MVKPEKESALFEFKELSGRYMSQRANGASPRLSYAQRVTSGAVLLVLVISLLNAAVHTKQVRATSRLVGNDVVSLSEKRFDELKRVLPSHGTVGYVSDVMPQIREIDYRGEGSDEETEREYALTQYALAPLIVDLKCEGHDIVVGNFRDSGNYLKITNANGLKLVRDFGNGIMLFSRAD